MSFLLHINRDQVHGADHYCLILSVTNRYVNLRIDWLNPSSHYTHTKGTLRPLLVNPDLLIDQSIHPNTHHDINIPPFSAMFINHS